MIYALILFFLPMLLMMCSRSTADHRAGVRAGLSLSGMISPERRTPRYDFNVLLMIAGTMGTGLARHRNQKPYLLIDLLVDGDEREIAIASFPNRGFITALSTTSRAVQKIAPNALAMARRLYISPVTHGHLHRGVVQPAGRGHARGRHHQHPARRLRGH
jgi:hypothetical protein